jgi:hypothetical protein
MFGALQLDRIVARNDKVSTSKSRMSFSLNSRRLPPAARFRHASGTLAAASWITTGLGLGSFDLGKAYLGSCTFDGTVDGRCTVKCGSVLHGDVFSVFVDGFVQTVDNAKD